MSMEQPSILLVDEQLEEAQVERNIDLEPVPNIIVEVLAPEGLGFGDGKISAKEVPENVKATVDGIIRANPLVRVGCIKDPETGDMVPVTDDGCGDGRGVVARIGAIFSKVGDNLRQFKTSLPRPKVFGGGNMMAAAGLIGAGDQAETFLKTATKSSRQMTRSGYDYGGHKDNHAHGDSCGCGAIDKAPQILDAAGIYRDGIIGAVRVLAGDAVADNDAPVVLDRYVAVSSDKEFTRGYTGKETMEETLVGNGKVVKELDGDHREVAIVLNEVRDCTVDQEKIRAGTNDEAQVFAVDVWRMLDIAEGMYPSEPGRQREAFTGMLVYTLATSGVLTDGSLRVYRIRQRSEFEAVSDAAETQAA